MTRTVTLKNPLKTPTGNVIAHAGTYELLDLHEHPDGSRTGTIFSEGHYARPMRVGFRLRKTDRVAGA